jgi:predicted Zn-dependent protease
MRLKWRLSHAQGYLALGMLEDAAAELDAVPHLQRGDLAVLALRIAVLQEQQKWAELQAAAAEYVRRRPHEPSGWVTWAYATRRTESLEAAEGILLEAERLHPSNPTIQFNLGCYACQRADLREARRRVNRAIALDARFREAASADPDLSALRAELADA